MQQMRISTNEVFSVMLRPKKLEIRQNVKLKEPIKTKQRAIYILVSVFRALEEI
jgi:hypothetical protein